MALPKGFVEAVRFAEERLRSLGTNLDGAKTFQPGQAQAIGLLMGLRSRSLFDATHYALRGPSDAAVRLIVRGMADLAILTAWLRLSPELHSELWEAEFARQQLELTGALQIQRVNRPDLDPLVIDQVAQQAQQAVVATARQRGLHAGVPGVSAKPNGKLMPNISERVDQVNTLVVREAYDLLVGWLSEWVHSGKGSFDDPSQVGAIDRQPDPNDYMLRSIAAVCHAVTLSEVSKWLGLGIESECDALRAGLTTRWPMT